MGTNATTISAASWPNRVRRGPASYDDGLKAHNDTRPVHACIRPSCPSCPVTTTVHEEHFQFNPHLTLDSDPFHTRYDRLDNVMGVTDSNGAAHALYTIDAFGNILEIANGGDYENERGSDVQPYHMTTKEYDADVGLYYFGARWYDPVTGRFLSLDPEDDLGSPYPICRNNPLTFADPTGQVHVILGTPTWWEWFWLALAIIEVCNKITGMTKIQLAKILYKCGITSDKCGPAAKCLQDCCKNGRMKLLWDEPPRCGKPGIRGWCFPAWPPCQIAVCKWVMQKTVRSYFALDWVSATIAHELLHSCDKTAMDSPPGKPPQTGPTHCFEKYFL